MVNIDIILFLGLVVLLLIFQKIIMLLIKKIAIAKMITPDIVNAISLIIKFLVAIAIIYLASIFLTIGEGATVILSVFLGSIISFASIHTIQNFVSGVYILITEPFSVNDLVKINNDEGLVTEISLNYTSILTFDGIIERIPNKKIISSLIINFDQKVKTNFEYQGKNTDWIQSIRKSIKDREVTRYVFTWGAPLMDLATIKQRINIVCDKYNGVFGYKPEYEPYTINHRFVFSFILSANNPIKILKNKTKFLDDINSQFH